jgi:hypothetical protein
MCIFSAHWNIAKIQCWRCSRDIKSNHLGWRYCCWWNFLWTWNYKFWKAPSICALQFNEEYTPLDTTNTYILLRYKWRHVSALIEPSLGQFYLQSLCKSNWSDDALIRAERWRRLYRNIIYICIVFDGVYYSAKLQGYIQVTFEESHAQVQKIMQFRGMRVSSIVSKHFVRLVYIIMLSIRISRVYNNIYLTCFFKTQK